MRGDVLKELERQIGRLNEFQQRPASTRAPAVLMTNLQRLRGELMGAGAAFLQPLRDSEFLNCDQASQRDSRRHLRIRPARLLPLAESQPDELRMRPSAQWLALLRPLCDAVAELLWLTRQNGRTRAEIAPGGIFHITFERDQPLQLLRISLPAAAGLYPEISGSHHRCNVRFLAWNGLAARPTQTEEDVAFTLSCCT